jgi:hypothetical protein
MNCEQIRERFVERFSGELSAELDAAVGEHLAVCPACREEYDSAFELWTALGDLPQESPSEALGERFHTMLDAYRQGAEGAQFSREADRRPSSLLARWWPRTPALQLAAAVGCLVIGLAAGTSLTGGNGQSEIAQLRNEMSSMRQLVALSLLQQQSASERLRAISWSRQLEEPRDDVLEALLSALDSDSNVNVRLAAVDALARFSDEPIVRAGLRSALERQDSPLVQIELIDLLAASDDSESISIIRKLGENEDLNPVVRERLEVVTQ